MLAAAWFVVALTVSGALRGGDPDFIVGGLGLIGDIAFANAPVLTMIAALMVIANLRGPLSSWRLRRIGMKLVAAVLFFVGFSMLKASMPLILPFHADRALARLDAGLHGGSDPWVFAHALLPDWPWGLVSFIYIELWLLTAIGFPVVLAIAEHDAGRRRRFLALFVFCWVGLGLAAALAGLSVGPIYYDRLLGGARFEALHDALARSGVADSALGALQDQLWAYYQGGEPAHGSGISAFPSVHVAIATLYMLYLAERSRWLLMPGILYLVTIQFLSVLTGYHYAIDGYVSILLVIAVWALLRRRDPRGAGKERQSDAARLPDPVLSANDPAR